MGENEAEDQHNHENPQGDPNGPPHDTLDVLLNSVPGGSDLLVQLVGLGLQPLFHLRTFGIHHGIDVVDVQAGADNPAPFLEERHKGELGLGLVSPVLGPQVVDKAFALFLGDPGKLDEQMLPVGVLVVGEVLAVHLGFVRVHDHGGVQVVDPEIIFALGTVTETLDEVGGFLLLILRTQPRLFSNGFQDTHGGLHLRLEIFLFKRKEFLTENRRFPVTVRLDPLEAVPPQAFDLGDGLASRPVGFPG